MGDRCCLPQNVRGCFCHGFVNADGGNLSDVYILIRLAALSAFIHFAEIKYYFGAGVKEEKIIEPIFALLMLFF